MAISFADITFGIIFFVVLWLFLYYKKEQKKIEGFPFYNILLKLLYDQVTGKIQKDVPFTSHAFQTFISVCKKHEKEGLVMMYLSRPVLFIFSEEAIKAFSSEKAALDKALEYEFVQLSMGDGLATSNGERWRTHRKMINPVFHMGMLKDKVPLFNEHASALFKDMEKLVGKRSVDILDVLICNYFNALSESVFGFKQDEANKAENVRCFNLIESLSALTAQIIIYPWLRPKFLQNFSSFGRNFRRQNKEYKSFITKVINDMKKHVASKEIVDSDRFGNHLKKSFTYILLNQHLNDPTFTFQDLHDEVSTILITGFDSVTYTTMWCLFMLGLHPEVQEKAFNEVQSITESYITYEDTCNLAYLEAVIMETLRLYPILPIYARNLSEDVQYGKYKVHKGTTIGFCPYVLHRNPDIYPDPEKYEPERFLNEESRRQWAFVPFAEGTRSCIGKKYAIIEIKIFLAYILRSFKITSLDKREDIRLCYTIGITPARHPRMQITSRQKPASMDESTEGLNLEL